jgi:hypothetical protein
MSHMPLHLQSECSIRLPLHLTSHSNTESSLRVGLRLLLSVEVATRNIATAVAFQSLYIYIYIFFFFLNYKLEVVGP